MTPAEDPDTDNDRRTFLKKCGVFAAVTPPAVTFLLSTSMSSKAIAASGGKGTTTRPGNGWGDPNHEHSGPPGQVNGSAAHGNSGPHH
jgi:hypothetical protein